MTSFPGWTFEYIDTHMTLPRMAAINAYQAKNTPLHVGVQQLVNGFLERK
jgi:hypothetical protein